MKAVFVRDLDGSLTTAIELLAEDDIERLSLRKLWRGPQMTVSCEEWREEAESDED